MRTTWTLALACAPIGALAVAACTGDDEIYRDEKDAGAFEASAPDAAKDAPPPDGGRPVTCGDAGGAPPRLLVTIGSTGSGELAAVNLQTNAVDGRLPIAAPFGGTVAADNREPFVLAQETDVVQRLDPREPWRSVASWNVRGADGADGGKTNANPSAIVVPECDKGYVLRFNRNRIAVIDTSETGTGLSPKSFVDLSGQLDANDSDGIVEMTAAVHAPAKKRVYVLLGNVDLKKVATDGFTALCAETRPSIVAIDTDTDQIVGAPIRLDGYNPPIGTPLWYDAKNDRLLVLSAGCNADDGDGGAGAITRRRVESVDLASGTVTTLLSLDDQGFPSAFEYVDETHAALAFFGQAFFWDPTQATLGPAISGGMDLFSSDGTGRLVGTRTTFLGDGGAGPLQIVSAPLGDAGTTVILEDPFTKNTGFVTSAEVWPRP